MSVLTTLIQRSVRSLSQCNKARNGNKNHNKKRTKMVTICIQHRKSQETNKTKQKTLGPKSKYNKVT